MNRDLPDGLPMLRVPPHSIEAESGVLGSLLLDNAAWPKVADVLSRDDFYRHEHREVFTAIGAMLASGKAADAVTVYAELQKIGKGEEIGGLAYIGALAYSVPSAGNIRRYAEIVRERATLRRLISAADEIAASAFDTQGQTLEQRLDEAERSILSIGLAQRRTWNDWVSAYDGMVKHSAILERRHAGELTAWPTRLPALDEYLEGGFRPGELVIVGARPSMGKTALGLTIAVNMACERSVAVLSMEMSHTDVNDRLTAMLGNVSLSEVKRPARGNGIDWTRVVDGTEKAKSLRLVVSDQGGLNINQVRSKARNAKRATGLEVLVVDYIGLMTGLNPKDNRNTQLGEISRGLKTLAKELGICVLCLAQLNRQAESRPDSMPQMSDLRDSGEIEQDADVILFIKRPIMASPDLGLEWTNYAKVSVAKNRQGRCGYLDLSYIGEQTRFIPWHGPAPVKAQPTTKRGGNL